jgi:hypothetical protein
MPSAVGHDLSGWHPSWGQCRTDRFPADGQLPTAQPPQLRGRSSARFRFRARSGSSRFSGEIVCRYLTEWILTGFGYAYLATGVGNEPRAL